MGAAFSKKDDAELGRKVKVAVASFEGAEAEPAPGADFVWALVNSLRDTGHIHFLIDDTVDACLCGMALAEAVEACGEACKTSFASYKHFRQLEIASSATVILLTLEQNKFAKFKEYEEGVKASTPEAWVHADQLRQEYEDSLDKVFVINANSRPTSRVFSSDESWKHGRLVDFSGTPAEKESPGRHNSNASLVLELIKAIQSEAYENVDATKTEAWGEKFVPLLSIANNNYDAMESNVPSLGKLGGFLTRKDFNAASLFELVKSIVHENRETLRKYGERSKLSPTKGLEEYIGQVHQGIASRPEEEKLRHGLVDAITIDRLSMRTLEDGAYALYTNPAFIRCVDNWVLDIVDDNGSRETKMGTEDLLELLRLAQLKARNESKYCAQDLSYLFGGMRNQLVADNVDFYSDHRPLLYRLGGLEVLQFNVLTSSLATGTQNPIVAQNQYSNLSYLHRGAADSVQKFTQTRNESFIRHIEKDVGFDLLILQEADASLVGFLKKADWSVEYQGKPHHATVSDEDSPFIEIGQHYPAESYGNLIAVKNGKGNSLSHRIAIRKTDDNTIIFAALVESSAGESYWVLNAHLKLFGKFDDPCRRATAFVEKFHEIAKARLGVNHRKPCVLAGDMNVSKSGTEQVTFDPFVKRKMKEQYEFFTEVSRLLSLEMYQDFSTEATTSSYNLGGLSFDHVAATPDQLLTDTEGNRTEFLEKTGLLMSGMKQSKLKLGEYDALGVGPTIFQLLNRIMIGNGSPFHQLQERSETPAEEEV